MAEALLHTLSMKADEAFQKRRWARAADLFKRAALQASVLYPHDSLVTVEQQFMRADALQGQADEMASRLLTSGRFSRRHGRSFGKEWRSCRAGT